MAGAGAGGTGGGTGGPVRVSAAAELTELGAPYWSRFRGHPFIVGAADGSLSDAALDRWFAQVLVFLAAYRRFHAGLLALTTDEHAGDLLGRAVASMRPELAQFRAVADARGVDAGVEPPGLAFVAFLRSSLRDGYQVGLAVLYATELSLRGAWAEVRETAREHSPIWPFIDNWTSPTSTSWLEDVARLVDAAAPLGATGPMRRAFERLLRYAVPVFDSVHTGEHG